MTNLKTGTSYFGNRIPRHVAKDMAQLKKQNFTYVLHTFNENDMLFYAKTMKEIVRITKEEGLDVQIDPWGVGKVFGGESFSNFVATNLDALQILSDDKPAGTACPMNPKFRAFMVEWIEAALETGAETIFWDEPHFNISTWLGGREGQWGCRCPICQGHFEERFGHEMPKTRTPEVLAYLEWGILDFLSYVIGEAAKRGAKNALCLLPHETGDEGATDQWEDFAAIPGLNIFGTDPYFQMFNKGMDYVEKFTKKAIDAAAKHNMDCSIWFQGFRIPAGQEHRQAEAMEIAYKLGCRDLAVWGFEACDHISWIRPDDPEAVWKVFVDKFGELHRRQG